MPYNIKTMKKKYAFVVFSLFVLLSLHANAQKETKKFSVGIGLEAGLPTGNDSKYYACGIGGPCVSLIMQARDL